MKSNLIQVSKEGHVESFDKMVSSDLNIRLSQFSDSPRDLKWLSSVGIRTVKCILTIDSQTKGNPRLPKPIALRKYIVIRNKVIKHFNEK